MQSIYHISGSIVFASKQDEPEEIVSETARMHKIYSQAMITLVALSGSSSHSPLPGVRFGSRVWNQHCETVKGLKLVTRYPSLITQIDRSIWIMRGWTLQEAAFFPATSLLYSHSSYFPLSGQDVL